MSTQFAMPEVFQPPPIQPGATSSMLDRSVCISIEIGRLGNSKRIDPSQVEVDADKSMVSFSKRLLESDELAAIAKFDARVRSYIASKCAPCAALRSGCYLLGVGLIDTVDAELQKLSAERDELVKKFLAVYEQQCLDAEPKLRSLHNPLDYKPLQRAANTFYLRWQYLEFAAAGKLRNVRKDLYEREQQKIMERWQDAEQKVQEVMREAMKELVDGMVESLTPREDGRKRKFHEAKLTNLAEFLRTFPDRNITNDEELAKLVSEAEQLLQGVDVGAIRSSEQTRDYLKERMGQMAATLNTMTEAQPSRKISFEEE